MITERDRVRIDGFLYVAQRERGSNPAKSDTRPSDKPLVSGTRNVGPPEGGWRLFLMLWTALHPRGSVGSC